MSEPHQPLDSLVHHHVLRAIAEQGFAPSAPELAARCGVPLEDAQASLVRLSDNHGLVLHPGTHDVWIAHPFALSPTATWVAGAARGWWAPCLWCAFGVHALVGEDVVVHTRLGGEVGDVRLRVRDGGPLETELVAHFPMPPRRAWDNVHHFCGMLLPFASEAQVDLWCARHRLPRGEVLSMPQLYALARRWYGGHLARDWVKHTPDEAAAIFEEIGLVGEFWDLDRGGARF